MGQAASYAESSVQRALLKLKQEELAEEEELLNACGYSRPSSAAVSHNLHETSSAPAPTRHADPDPTPDTGSSSTAEKALPPAPSSFGPYVSLAPEYYSLDELRDALRYLPDMLWVSLYRVSLLYILDNDHDGQIKSADISFFMDWGIRTVGRDVPPEQLAEVLQTYAALHCWHRCLHVGEVIEAERTAAAAAQASGRNGAANSAAARNRRRQLPGGGGGGAGGGLTMMGGLGNGAGGGGAGGGAAGAHHHHHHPPVQNVASFMLLHLREAFFTSRPGGPPPLPSNAPVSPAATPMPVKESTTTTTTTTTATNAAAGGDGGLSSPPAAHFCSPRSAVTQPVTSTTRLEAAAHFAEWMLRLVQHQERDRRHERQRLERRVRLISAAEARVGGSRLLHSQLLQHHSSRLRGGSVTLFPSMADTGDSEDVVTSQSVLRVRATLGLGEEAEPEVVAMTAPRLSLPDNDVVAGLAGNTSSSTAVARTGSGGGRATSSPSSRSITPLGSTSALAKAQREGAGCDGAPSHSGTKFGSIAGDASPLPQPQQPHSQRGRLPAPASNFSVSSSSRALPVFATQTPVAQSEENAFLSSNPMKHSGPPVDGERPGNSPNWYGNVPVQPEQLAAVLMDAEVFYRELERNGWCTIGAVEEAYLDFAVEDSYCLTFWAFCRLLNEASADEVQAALEMTTAQATAALTSAAAVEEHRRAAALRQFQRVNGAFPRTFSHSGGWERQLQVVPMFIVSEYTFVAFVTAFIHAYWDMLESMGIDAVTQPAELPSMLLTTRSTSAGFRAP